MKKCDFRDIMRWRGEGLLSVIFLLPFLSSGITLSWDANTEDDLAGYKVYYGESSREYSQVIWVGDETEYELSGLKGGDRYFFAVTAIDYSGNESEFSGEVSAIFPDTGNDDPGPVADQNDTALGTLTYNYPNPFRVRSETTAIRYELLKPAEVSIEILDVNMNLIKRIIHNSVRPAGEHTQDVWDGQNSEGEYVSNGVYYCKISSNGEQRVIKIAVVR